MFVRPTMAVIHDRSAHPNCFFLDEVCIWSIVAGRLYSPSDSTFQVIDLQNPVVCHSLDLSVVIRATVPMKAQEWTAIITTVSEYCDRFLMNQNDGLAIVEICIAKFEC